ncbi:Immunity protein Imm1 [Actinokineospora alba]|uniref:Immunity protein Imm1 n=2 Tax=Actinokineospora alba TaxID=504798 RepID=A0A1H0QNE2_9PSEU|nr:immunity protein Imm1 of predicted polymorphic toxin system [Actinokineospora alba]SDI30907.1 Immunity protein Imm1 [Actinokineospora alba]SDP18883.1 Immunity protein Imm1 [Actinokineospora alba]
MHVLTTTAPFGATLRTTDGGGVASELVVGIHDNRGALYYSDDTGSWYTHGPTPDDHGPVYAEVDFPDHSEIPAADIRAALTEYVHKQARPIGVTWKQDPFAG